MASKTLTPDLLHKIDAHWHAADCLSVGEVCLFDNPELVVACVVGDGEAETGPTATAWHSNMFLDPVAVVLSAASNGRSCHCERAE